MVVTSVNWRVVVAFTVADHGPVPATFTAAARNVYAVLPVNPVTSAVVEADTPSVAVVHVPPPSVDHCTT